MSGDEAQREVEEAEAIRLLLTDFDDSEDLLLLDDARDTVIGGRQGLQLAHSPLPGAAAASEHHAGQFNGGIKPSTRAQVARRKQKNPNRARNARRLEIIRLRRQATELESALDGFRRDDARRWGSHAGRSRTPGQTQTTIAAWEKLAREQRARREQSEAENTHLRLLVSGHVKIASRMRRLLMPNRLRPAHVNRSANTKAHSGDDQAHDGDFAASASLSADGLSADSFTRATKCSQIFGMLKHNVARARVDMDAVFIANGLAGTETTYRSAKVEQDDARGTTMEVAASRVLPYDLEPARRVAWRHFNDVLSRMPDRVFFEYHDEQKTETLDGVDDMIASSYTYELGNGYVSAKFDQWRVIGQYIEPDRVIIIYCIVTETTEFASKPVSGIRILKRVFIVLRRLSGDAAGGENSAGNTLMQSCYCFQPVQYETTLGLEQTLAAVTDFMFGFIGGRISLNYQMIERELEAMTG